MRESKKNDRSNEEKSEEEKTLSVSLESETVVINKLKIRPRAAICGPDYLIIRADNKKRSVNSTYCPNASRRNDNCPPSDDRIWVKVSRFRWYRTTHSSTGSSSATPTKLARSS